MARGMAAEQKRAAKFRKVLDGAKSARKMTDWDILKAVPDMSRTTLCGYRSNGPDKMALVRFCDIMHSVGATGREVCEILGFQID